MVNKQLIIRYASMVLLAIISSIMVLSYAKSHRNKQHKHNYTAAITSPETNDKIVKLLQRIVENDHNIKAIQHILFDTQNITNNNAGPLHDMVLGIKDLFRLQDYDTHAGLLFPVWENAQNIDNAGNDIAFHSDNENAGAIAKIINGGATLLATTRLTEGAWTEYNTQCLTDDSCPPNNPFAPGVLWQGDSSSGCGTGLAAGFFDACIATDTSGSIRNPCLMNSLMCIKPSQHTISRDGVWPLSQQLDTVGVMARDSEDLLAIMQVYDTYTANEQLQPINGMTLGVDMNLIANVKQDFPELAESLYEVINDYKKLGVNIKQIDLLDNITAQMDYLANSAETTISYDAYRTYKNFSADEVATINTQLTNLLTEGQNINIDDVNDIKKAAATLRDYWQKLYNEHELDAVLLFVWGVPAPLLDEIPSIITNPSLFATAVRYMVPFNYIDSPLVVVPQKTASTSCEYGNKSCLYADRPMAFQLIGSYNDDAIIKLLSLSHAYEEQRGKLQYPFMSPPIQ